MVFEDELPELNHGDEVPDSRGWIQYYFLHSLLRNKQRYERFHTVELFIWPRK